MPQTPPRFLHTLQRQILVLWRTKAFWTRALLCWFIGMIVLHNDETNNYDLRLKIRGPRRATEEVVLIDVTERAPNAFLKGGLDWPNLNSTPGTLLWPARDNVTYSDASFWNQRTWHSLLEKVLADEPRAVGVNFFFGENVTSQRFNVKKNEVFFDDRVVWGTDLDGKSRPAVPLFADPKSTNVGLRFLKPDDDGAVRRSSPGDLPFPDFVLRVALRAHPELGTWLSKVYGGSQLINFSGDVQDGAFTVINARDLVEGHVPARALKDKTILIGSLGNPVEQIQTAVGRMSRTEVYANILDNMVAKKTIKRFDESFYVFFLVLILMAAVWVLATYPQSVALIAFILEGLILLAFSAWTFDIATVWFPIFSPLIELTAACIVFLSYQLTRNERRTWRLEQERRYLEEIEQLKTNFVSMMSHDLKTPIAKIQAICDRLLASPKDPEVVQDLRTLRRSSDELHRYIQSILQVTKVEAKDFQIKKVVTDINENIERVIVRLQPLATEKSLSISTDLEPLFSIEADTTLIQEVVHNLIENAIKYTPAGGRISIRSREQDDFVTVEIEDSGPGISADDQKLIWGKFTRGRDQTTAIQGTGLGLYLVKYFVELHGGQTLLDSEPGRGTKIGFKIPVATASDAVDEGA